MHLKAVPLFPLWRALPALAIGGLLSWNFRERLTASWRASRPVGDAVRADPTVAWLWSDGVTLAAHWLVGAFSLIMTVSAVWLILIVAELAVRSSPWTRNQPGSARR
jgi:hypothetical protein